MTGKLEYEDILNRIKAAGLDLDALPHIQVRPYLYNMPQAMAMADLAIFRAGATGLAELTARGIRPFSFRIRMQRRTIRNTMPGHWKTPVRPA